MSYPPRKPLEWHKVSDDYWMCFSYDVWRDNGVWYASLDGFGSRFHGDFKTPQAAMRHCDQHWLNPFN